MFTGSLTFLIGAQSLMGKVVSLNRRRRSPDHKRMYKKLQPAFLAVVCCTLRTHERSSKILAVVVYMYKPLKMYTLQSHLRIALLSERLMVLNRCTNYYAGSVTNTFYREAYSCVFMSDHVYNIKSKIA